MPKQTGCDAVTVLTGKSQLTSWLSVTGPCAGPTGAVPSLPGAPLNRSGRVKQLTRQTSPLLELTALALLVTVSVSVTCVTVFPANAESRSKRKKTAVGSPGPPSVTA